MAQPTHFRCHAMNLFNFAEDWKQKLQDLISEEDLPVHWGGTAIDPGNDEFCRTKVALEIVNEYLMNKSLININKNV